MADTYELVETLGSTETGGACADDEGLYFGGGHVGHDGGGEWRWMEMEVGRREGREVQRVDLCTLGEARRGEASENENENDTDS